MTDELTYIPPPHNVEAEQNIIGALLGWPEKFVDVASKLSPEDFYTAPMREGFAAMIAVDSIGRHIELFELEGYLKQCNPNGEWLNLLVECQKSVPSVVNLHRYVEVVKQCAIERRMMTHGSEIQELARADLPLSSKVDKAQALISDLSAEAVTRGPQHVTQHMAGLDEEMKTRVEQKGITGVATGYGPIDRRHKGLQRTDLIIIAGRPAMGKTSLAMNIAEFVSQAAPVLVFSMEMSAEQLRDRCLSSLGRIPLAHIKDGSALNHAEYGAKLEKARHALATRHLYIDDSPALSVHEIRSRARTLALQQGTPAAIIVDYLQLMPGQEATSRDTREREIAHNTSGLKSLAKELRCPVVALSQLNRSLENRPNKRPVLSDLRESGAIEQDSDVVMFVYRDEVYYPNTDWLGVAEIITAKYRNGHIGTDYLITNLDKSRFDIPAATWSPPEQTYHQKQQKGFE